MGISFNWKKNKNPKNHFQNGEGEKDTINDPCINFHFSETSPNYALRYNEILRWKNRLCRGKNGKVFTTMKGYMKNMEQKKWIKKKIYLKEE